MNDLPTSTAIAERRAHPRTPINFSIRVAAYREGVDLNHLLFLTREGRDISAGGIGFFAPAAPANAEIVVELPGEEQVSYWLAHVRHVQRIADVRYAVGCQFIRKLA